MSESYKAKVFFSFIDCGADCPVCNKDKPLTSTWGLNDPEMARQVHLHTQVRPPVRGALLLPVPEGVVMPQDPIEDDEDELPSTGCDGW